MRNSFFKAIVALLFVVVLHFVMIYANTGFPIVLLYTPILIYAHLSLSKQEDKLQIILGLLPFFVMFFSYIYINWIIPRDAQIIKYYYSSYYLMMIFTLLLSPVYVLLNQNKWETPTDKMKEVLMQQLSVLSIIIGLLVTIILINYWYEVPLDIHPRFIIYMLMIFGSFLKLRYVHYNVFMKEPIIVLEEKPCTLSSESKDPGLSIVLLEKYARRIDRCMKEEKLYLKHNMSIDLLIRQSGIPRRHLSGLFNDYLHTSFYRFVAEYRIRYALDILSRDSNNSLTLEGLAYECGFNSKTTFNKYFREIIGCTLSEYKEEMKKEQNRKLSTLVNIPAFYAG